jgi:hypothetical protein
MRVLFLLKLFDASTDFPVSKIKLPHDPHPTILKGFNRVLEGQKTWTESGTENFYDLRVDWILEYQ